MKLYLAFKYEMFSSTCRGVGSNQNMEGQTVDRKSVLFAIPKNKWALFINDGLFIESGIDDFESFFYSKLLSPTLLTTDIRTMVYCIFSLAM